MSFMKPSQDGWSSKWTFFVLILACVTGLFISGLGQNITESQAESPTPQTKSTPTKIEAAPKAEENKSRVLPDEVINQCSDEKITQELTQVRTSLIQKQKELEKREQEIKAKEAALESELKKFDQLKSEMNQLAGAVQDKQQEKIAKLVETFEGMSPKASAGVIKEIDEDLAVKALKEISSLKLGKILGTLEPEKAARISEKIAGYSKRAVKKEVNVSMTKGETKSDDDTKQQSGSVPVIIKQ